MKLYYGRGACSLSVHIALHEIGAAFEAVPVDLVKHQLPDGSDFRAISPRGYVPLLELDDGSRHTEVAALLQYVGDLSPQQALIGAVGTPRRLAVTEALVFVATELHKAFSPWLWHQETAESTRAEVQHKLDQRFAELEARFAEQPWVAGDYSVADAYAFTILNWTRFLKMPLASYPAIEGYLKRMRERPAVAAALKAEGLR